MSQIIGFKINILKSRYDTNKSGRILAQQVFVHSGGYRTVLESVEEKSQRVRY